MSQGRAGRWWIEATYNLACSVHDGEKLVLATMPPFSSAEVALRLSRHLGIPWVADLRDTWALDEILDYTTVLHRKRALAEMGRLLSSASLVIMNTPEAKAALLKAFPWMQDRNVTAITNGYDEEDFSREHTPRKDGKFRIVHSAGFLTLSEYRSRYRWLQSLLGGAVHGVDISTLSHLYLIKALDAWIREKPRVKEDVEVVFAGKASEADREIVMGTELESTIKFLGYVPHDQSVDLLCTADLLFLPWYNLPAGTRSTKVPGKLYEYMAARRPILGAVPDGDVRDFLTKCGTGFVCRPDDVAGMADIIERLYIAWKRGESLTQPNLEFVNQSERRAQTRVLANALNKVLKAERSAV
jgi:glycosyltransferase involved in cell wall biosynthesis